MVNAGIAVGTKEAQAQNLQMLLNMYQQAIPAGMASVEHAAYAFGRLVENMGYKNTGDFCFKPEQVAQMKQAAQQQAAPAASRPAGGPAAGDGAADGGDERGQSAATGVEI